MKKHSNKIFKSFLQAGAIGLFTIFGWLIVQGTLAVFPRIAGITMIIIGVVGMSILIYLGVKK